MEITVKILENLESQKMFPTMISGINLSVGWSKSIKILEQKNEHKLEHIFMFK